MEHFYENIPGWFNFQDIYKLAVSQTSPNGKYNFVEVGCWKGKSAAFLAVEIANSKNDIQLYCVDTWKGSNTHRDPKHGSYDPACFTELGVLPQFMENMKSVKHLIKPIQTTSIEASKQFKNDFFDFIFIDASHEYEDVKDDLQSWFPKLKDGSMFAGHDYDQIGVKRAVDELAIENKLYVQTTGNSWIIKKVSHI